MDSLRQLIKAQTAGSEIAHPLAQVDAQGRLQCKVCHKGIGSGALWTVHLSSTGHRSALDALRMRVQTQALVAASSSAAQRAPTSDRAGANFKKVAPGPTLHRHFESGAAASLSDPAGVPHQTATHVQYTEPLPVGFFDDADTDALARGIDTGALRREAEADALSSFMASVGADGAVHTLGSAMGDAESDAARDAEEERRGYEERAAREEDEHVMLRVRLSLWREGIDPRLDTNEQQQELGTKERLGEGGQASSSLLARRGGMEEAMRKRRRILVGAQPRPDFEVDNAAEAADEQDGELLNWRKRG